MIKMTLLLCLLTFNICFSQKNATKLIKFENKEFSIIYTENLKLEEFEKTNTLISNIFVITNTTEKVKMSFPFIYLNIIDCSGLGMGTIGIIEDAEKGKLVNKRVSKLNNTKFDEVKSELNDFTEYEYIFVKNNKVYRLSSLTKTIEFNVNSQIIMDIMNTFELK